MGRKTDHDEALITHGQKLVWTIAAPFVLLVLVIAAGIINLSYWIHCKRWEADRQRVRSEKDRNDRLDAAFPGTTSLPTHFEFPCPIRGCLTNTDHTHFENLKKTHTFAS